MGFEAISREGTMSLKQESGKQQFEIACASRGFHVYREIWRPKLGQMLQVSQEIGKVHDHFAISLGANIPGKLSHFDIVGHIPREISRFCHYFINYGGKIEARVRCIKYRPSPIPTGGLEIPILLTFKKGESTDLNFEKMESFIRSYYIEPDKIATDDNRRIDDIDFDVEYWPESETETHSFEECVPETQTEVIPETQDIGYTQVIPETQDVIVIED